MLLNGWIWPSPRARRAELVEGYLQGYAPGESIVVADVPFLPAVCPCCAHVTDDEMLLDLTLLDDAQKATLGLPIGPEAWCNNVCLATWLRTGGSLKALYTALGAPADVISLAP